MRSYSCCGLCSILSVLQASRSAVFSSVPPPSHADTEPPANTSNVSFALTGGPIPRLVSPPLPLLNLSNAQTCTSSMVKPTVSAPDALIDDSHGSELIQDFAASSGTSFS